MRVLHLPGRTPFARNLQGGKISLANGQGQVPVDASFAWLAQTESWDCFDVIHIHTLELAKSEDIEACLEICRRRGKGIVATLHEDRPLFSDDRNQFFRRIQVLGEADVVLTTLTQGCRESLVARTGFDPKSIAVIPHGNVLPLDSDIWNAPTPAKSDAFVFSIHGGFRPNKRLLDAVLNFAASPALETARMKIMTRALSSTEYWLNRDARAVCDLAMGARNIDLLLRPHITDEEVARFVLGSDAMVLPYAWGSHSGQIELAADLGVRVVTSNVGFYSEQTATNGLQDDGLVHWADWAGTDAFMHGSEMLSALETAFDAPATPGRDRKTRHEFRREERQRILQAYSDAYETALGLTMKGR